MCLRSLSILSIARCVVGCRSHVFHFAVRRISVGLRSRRTVAALPQCRRQVGNSLQGRLSSLLQHVSRVSAGRAGRYLVFYVFIRLIYQFAWLRQLKSIRLLRSKQSHRRKKTDRNVINSEQQQKFSSNFDFRGLCDIFLFWKSIILKQVSYAKRTIEYSPLKPLITYQLFSEIAWEKSRESLK